jgi:hypothetical protein
MTNDFDIVLPVDRLELEVDAELWVRVPFGPSKALPSSDSV